LKIGSGDATWLANFHNYLYPSFLALLHAIGIWDRLGVGAVQLALLYVGTFVLAAVLWRCYKIPFVYAAIVTCGIALLPAAAWSGYWLSESLAAPVLMLAISLWVLTCYGVMIRPGARSTAAVVVGLGFASGSAWMTRPALLWLPVVVVAMIALMVPASLLIRRSGPDPQSQDALSIVRAVGLVGAVLAGTALSLVPQLVLDDQVMHLFKLDLAQWQAHRATTMRR
jgi:hypothetical protein